MTTLKKNTISPELLLELAGSACRCIYQSRLIKSNDIKFPRGIKFSEDRIFNIYAFGFANQISYMKEALYYRYVNLKSAVHRFHNDYFEAYKKAKTETEKALKIAWDNDKSYQKAYLSQFITGSLMAINNYYYKTSPLSQKEKKAAVKKLCEDTVLREAIASHGVKAYQEKWIINRNYNLLILRAKLANLKHGR